MRSLITILVMAVVFCPLTANATIINIPGDYPTIQEGIDHGADGDTILVQPGTYYENVNFREHSVVLASLFLMTGDTAYVSSTIIDGDSAGSVITIESSEDRRAQVIGFTIQNGFAGNGGGIRCSGTSPAIRNNNIIDNFVLGEYAGGGGIACYNSNVVISDNRISGNQAEAWEGIACGGGIDCHGSTAEISGNIISGNALDNVCGTNYGGGICCCASDATIRNNRITGNSSFHYGWGGDGGGVYCLGSNPTFSNNVLSHNQGEHGGGITFISSVSNLANNTFTGNWGYYDGGAIYCADSYITITNSILWEDSAWFNDSEIYVESGTMTVTYCDVEGGWPGTGNIDADPIFIAPDREDFYLRWHSPCIDAGDPDPQYNDPDGTRNDMGAYYFNQGVLGVVEVYPYNEPIVIPPEGGEITYDGGIWNFARGPLTVDIYAYAFVPGWTERYRLWRHRDVTIPAHDSVVRTDLVEHVPDFAPAGDYLFATYIGDHPHTIIDSCYFYFTKEEVAYVSGGSDAWGTLKGWFDEDLIATASSPPTHYALSQNYPNPFNATTVINYHLPVDAYVKLDVYSSLGQKVATLTSGKQEAGYKCVNWDATEVSSGLYFYKLTAGDFTETRRMMLLK